MQEKKFEFSSILMGSVKDKVATDYLESTLNQRIDLSVFGSSVKKIVFVFIVVKPEYSRHPNKIHFDKDNGSLEIALRLSYVHVLSSSPEEVHKMMTTLFIKSFDLLAALRIPDFQLDRFSTVVSKALKDKE